MLDSVIGKVPAANDLLRPTSQLLDAILLAWIAERATNTDPIAADYADHGEIQGLCRPGAGATFEQEIGVGVTLTRTTDRRAHSAAATACIRADCAWQAAASAGDANARRTATCL